MVERRTAHKASVDLSPLVWCKAARTLQGVPAGDRPCHEYVVAGSSETVVNLFEEAQEPFNAGAWVKRRQQAEVLASASDPGNKKKAKVEKFTPLDFTAMVLRKNLLTPNAALAHVQEYGSLAGFKLQFQTRLVRGEAVFRARTWKSQ